MDQEPSEPLPLVLRHGHNARHVVLLLAMLLLAEVTDQVAALIVVLGEDVEEKWLHVVVEGFVVEEQLREQAQVLGR